MEDGHQMATPARSVDCIGFYCPEPLFRARLAMDSLAPGQVLEVRADDPAAPEDLRRFAERTGNEFLAAEPEAGAMRILIRKGPGKT